MEGTKSFQVGACSFQRNIATNQRLNIGTHQNLLNGFFTDQKEHLLFINRLNIRLLFKKHFFKQKINSQILRRAFLSLFSLLSPR